ncbi:MAG: VOC family protein [Proteobacteria bacterium]|nr:VOC family protein [Pseudomonadota bacterium]
MAKIRHVVYRAADLEAMANFFVNAFEMTIVRRRPEGGIDLSDGTIHLAVLPVRTAEQRLGFEHIGFMVEDEQQACRRLEAAGAREFGRTVDPYQIKFLGPEGIEVEIGNWPGAEPIRKDAASGE